MRALKTLDWNKVLFFDIETSRAVDVLTKDNPLYEAWEYKMRYSIEADKKGFTEDTVESYAEKAALYAEFSVITCISVGYIKNNKLVIKSFYGQNEHQIITDFFEVLDAFQGSWGSKLRLCGHAIIGFDIPFVMRRAIVNGLPPHDLMDVSGLKPWQIDWVVDTKELWKGSSWGSASLISLAAAFGLPNPKMDIAGHETSDAFFRGEVERIALYCERDVLTVCNALRVMGGLSPVEKEVSALEIERMPLLVQIYNTERATKEQIAQVAEMIKTIENKEAVKDILQVAFRGNVPEELKID